MGKSKVKGGKRLRAVNILLADYLQMTASKLINRSTNINEIGELIDIICDAKRFISGDEDIDIRGAENLERDLINVIGSYSRLENNAVARFTTIEMSNKHAIRKAEIVESVECAKLPKKLHDNITMLINEDKGCTFWEFTHGSGTYRLIKVGNKEYSLMNYSKKLNSWIERSVFETKKER